MELTPEQVVEEFGRRMKQVSTLAPPATAAATIRETYAGLVAPALLDRWAGAPSTAPGRQTSSPWPDRIEVISVFQPRADFIVTGTLIEASSTGESARTPVEVTVRHFDDGWLIADYRVEEADAVAAKEALRAYYAAISAHDYPRAYEYWGPAPKQPLDEFTRGFADTASAEVQTGMASRVEPAAGSRYVRIPVTITARTTSGETRRFEGIYTMRRVVVDGAPASATRWHIYDAKLRAAL